MNKYHISIRRSSPNAGVTSLRALGQASTDAIPRVLVGSLASAVSASYMRHLFIYEP
jgi:hypothetical protein